MESSHINKSHSIISSTFLIVPSYIIILVHFQWHFPIPALQPIILKCQGFNHQFKYLSNSWNQVLHTHFFLLSSDQSDNSVYSSYLSAIQLPISSILFSSQWLPSIKDFISLLRTCISSLAVAIALILVLNFIASLSLKFFIKILI